MDIKTLERMPPWEWPEEAREMLMATLDDSKADRDDRILAAELSGDFVVIDDDLADALLAIATSGDEPARLRCAAAISLGPALEHTDSLDFEEEENPEEAIISRDTFQRIQSSLHALFEDKAAPSDVRRMTLEASVRAPSDWHTKAVDEAYNSDNAKWKLTAVFCTCFVRGFDRYIIEALESEDPEIRYHAVLAAGNWEIEASWPHIAGILRADGPEKGLLMAAIAAAPWINPGEASDLLLGLDDSDEDTADAIQEALSAIEQGHDGLAGEDEETMED